MRPRRGLQRPNAVGIFLPEQFDQLSEYCVIVRQFVVADTFPVERLGRSFRVGITVQYRSISPFRVSPVFVHESDAGEPHF